MGALADYGKRWASALIGLSIGAYAAVILGGTHNRWRIILGAVGLAITAPLLFRELSKEDREVLIGERAGYFICRVCWPVVFGEEDEDE